MFKHLRPILLFGIISHTLISATAIADWNIGDGHKMHYPQLPDPDGWDLNVTSPQVLADDWRCRETGPVGDIHFWLSAEGDPDIGLVVDSVDVSIYSNTNEGLFSQPKDLLWDRNFPRAGVTTRLWDHNVEPTQGFFWPERHPDGRDGPRYLPNDHHDTYQLNITEIEEPFMQQEDEIYWLALSIHVVDQHHGFVGWKSSRSRQFMDDAVWAVDDGMLEWNEIRHPQDPNRSLDLAFVITGAPRPDDRVPEPATAGLALLGLAALAIECRQRLSGYRCEVLPGFRVT